MGDAGRNDWAKRKKISSAVGVMVNVLIVI